MSTFVIIVKIALTLFFSVGAAMAASTSVQKATCEKRKIETPAFAAIMVIGGLSGLFAILLPVGWPVQLIFITTYMVMQLVNTEGKARATSWMLLTALSGIMLLWGVWSWQNSIHGLAAGMLTFGAVYTSIPIIIGLYKGFLKTEHLNIGENAVERTTKKVVTKHWGIALAGVFLLVCVATLGTAIIWLIS